MSLWWPMASVLSVSACIPMAPVQAVALRFGTVCVGAFRDEELGRVAGLAANETALYHEACRPAGRRGARSSLTGGGIKRNRKGDGMNDGLSGGYTPSDKD